MGYESFGIRACVRACIVTWWHGQMFPRSLCGYAASQSVSLDSAQRGRGSGKGGMGEEERTDAQ